MLSREADRRRRALSRTTIRQRRRRSHVRDRHSEARLAVATVLVGHLHGHRVRAVVVVAVRGIAERTGRRLVRRIRAMPVAPLHMHLPGTVRTRISEGAKMEAGHAALV